jgi:ribonuclease HI
VERAKEPAKSVATKAMHMYTAWKAAHREQETGGRTHNTASAEHASALAAAYSRAATPGPDLRQWRKPRSGWLKCNVDASISPGSVGWGLCVRNADGRFVAAGTNNCSYKLNVVESEAKALLEAMQEAIKRGWTNMIFESDSKIVVEAIQVKATGISDMNSIITSIKMLLHCNSNFEVKFVRRQANIAAHTLARVASSWTRRNFFDYIPRCIELVILNEMN